MSTNYTIKAGQYRFKSVMSLPNDSSLYQQFNFTSNGIDFVVISVTPGAIFYDESLGGAFNDTHYWYESGWVEGYDHITITNSFTADESFYNWFTQNLCPYYTIDDYNFLLPNGVSTWRQLVSNEETSVIIATNSDEHEQVYYNNENNPLYTENGNLVYADDVIINSHNYYVGNGSFCHVCGRPLGYGHDLAYDESDGLTYYFCSEKCHDVWQNNTPYIELNLSDDLILTGTIDLRESDYTDLDISFYKDNEIVLTWYRPTDAPDDSVADFEAFDSLLGAGIDLKNLPEEILQDSSPIEIQYGSTYYVKAYATDYSHPIEVVSNIITINIPTYKQYLFYKAEITTSTSDEYGIALFPWLYADPENNDRTYYLVDHTNNITYSTKVEPDESGYSWLKFNNNTIQIHCYTDSTSFYRTDKNCSCTYSLYYNTDNYSDEGKSYVLYQKDSSQMGGASGNEVQLYLPMRKIALNDLKNNIPYESGEAIPYYIPKDAIIELEDGSIITPIHSTREYTDGSGDNTSEYTVITADINGETVTFYDSRDWSLGGPMYTLDSTGEVIISIYQKSNQQPEPGPAKNYLIYRLNCRANTEDKWINSSGVGNLSLSTSISYKARINDSEYDCDVTIEGSEEPSFTIVSGNITISQPYGGAIQYTNTSNENVIYSLYYIENSSIGDSSNEDRRIYWGGTYDTDMWYNVAIKNRDVSSLSNFFNISISENAHIDYNGVYVGTLTEVASDSDGSTYEIEIPNVGSLEICTGSGPYSFFTYPENMTGLISIYTIDNPSLNEIFTNIANSTRAKGSISSDTLLSLTQIATELARLNTEYQSSMEGNYEGFPFDALMGYIAGTIRDKRGLSSDNTFQLIEFPEAIDAIEVLEEDDSYTYFNIFVNNDSYTVKAFTEDLAGADPCWEFIQEDDILTKPEDNIKWMGYDLFDSAGVQVGYSTPISDGHTYTTGTVCWYCSMKAVSSIELSAGDNIYVYYCSEHYPDYCSTHGTYGLASDGWSCPKCSSPSLSSMYVYINDVELTLTYDSTRELTWENVAEYTDGFVTPSNDYVYYEDNTLYFDGSPVWGAEYPIEGGYYSTEENSDSGEDTVYDTVEIYIDGASVTITYATESDSPYWEYAVYANDFLSAGDEDTILYKGYQLYYNGAAVEYGDIIHSNENYSTENPGNSDSDPVCTCSNSGPETEFYCESCGFRAYYSTHDPSCPCYEDVTAGHEDHMTDDNYCEGCGNHLSQCAWCSNYFCPSCDLDNPDMLDYPTSSYCSYSCYELSQA